MAKVDEYLGHRIAGGGGGGRPQEEQGRRLRYGEPGCQNDAKEHPNPHPCERATSKGESAQ